MNVTMWPLTNIQPYAGNPRHNDQAVDAVARSIQEFGFRQPIVVDEHGVIIVGHTRYKTALTAMRLKPIWIGTRKRSTSELLHGM